MSSSNALSSDKAILQLSAVGAGTINPQASSTPVQWMERPSSSQPMRQLAEAVEHNHPQTSTNQAEFAGSYLLADNSQQKELSREPLAAGNLSELSDLVLPEEG